MDGHADIQIERDHKRRGGSGLQKVRDLGAYDQDVRQLDDRPGGADRRHEAVAERHLREYRNPSPLGPASIVHLTDYFALDRLTSKPLLPEIVCQVNDRGWTERTRVPI